MAKAKNHPFLDKRANITASTKYCDILCICASTNVVALCIPAVYESVSACITIPSKVVDIFHQTFSIGAFWEKDGLVKF